MKFNCKKIIVCLFIFSFLIILTNVTYATVDFSLNQANTVLSDGNSFEFQIRITDTVADARSFSGSMDFNEQNIRIDSIVGLSSNWKLQGRNLSLGTFFMTRVYDENASVNEPVLRVRGTVLKDECEEVITVKNFHYTDLNDVQINSNKSISYLVKKIAPIFIDSSNNTYESGNTQNGDSIINVIGGYGSSQGNQNNNNNNNSLVPSENQNGNGVQNNTGNNNNQNSNNQQSAQTGNNNSNTGNVSGNQNSSQTGNVNGASSNNSNTGKTNNNKGYNGNVNKDNTVTTADRAPQTGSDLGKYIIIALVCIVITGFVCYIGFRKNNF